MLSVVWCSTSCGEVTLNGVGNRRSAPVRSSGPQGIPPGHLECGAQDPHREWVDRERGYGGGLPDVGMFWDFGSLFQKPRVDNQEELFNKGLAASNVWYGSSQSTVWKASQSTKSCCISRRLLQGCL